MKVAFYDAKAYDMPSFEHYGSMHGMTFKFLETKLNEDTADLARGCDAVCVFVNDTVNAAVIEKLYDQGIRLVALRSIQSSPACTFSIALSSTDGGSLLRTTPFKPCTTTWSR